MKGQASFPASRRPCGRAKRGFFSRQDFTYDAEKDHYICPAGQTLTKGLVRSIERTTSTITVI